MAAVHLTSGVIESHYIIAAGVCRDMDELTETNRQQFRSCVANGSLTTYLYLYQSKSILVLPARRIAFSSLSRVDNCNHKRENHR